MSGEVRVFTFHKLGFSFKIFLTVKATKTPNLPKINFRNSTLPHSLPLHTDEKLSAKQVRQSNSHLGNDRRRYADYSNSFRRHYTTNRFRTFYYGMGRDYRRHSSLKSSAMA